MLPAASTPAAHVGEMGRAVIVPAEFVPAHELDPHGPADRLRHHRGTRSRNRHGRRDRTRRRLRSTGPGPDRRRARASEPACCARRAETGSSTSRARSRRRHRRARSSAQMARGIDKAHNRSQRRHVRRRARAAATSPVSTITKSVVRDVRMASKSLPGAGRRGGTSHVTLSFSAARTASHSRSATTPTKSPLRTTRAPAISADRTCVDADDLGAVSIGALPTRTHDASVQHAGHAHVLHVNIFAADLVGNVDARRPGGDEPVLGDRLLRAPCRSS